MKQIAVIKNVDGKLLEIKSFQSRKALERYVAVKYEKGTYDWEIRNCIVETIPNKQEKELGLSFGFREVKKHFIVVW